MIHTATLRELRNRFPAIRKMVEEEGAILVTERGVPKYRLTSYSPQQQKAPAQAKDYLQRLRRHQPRPLSAAAAKALHDHNRGER